MVTVAHPEPDGTVVVLLVDFATAALPVLLLPVPSNKVETPYAKGPQTTPLPLVPVSVKQKREELLLALGTMCADASIGIMSIVLRIVWYFILLEI